MGFLIWLPVVSVVKASFMPQTGEGWGEENKQTKKSHFYVSFANDQTVCIDKNKKTLNADDFLKTDSRFIKYY